LDENQKGTLEVDIVGELGGGKKNFQLKLKWDVGASAWGGGIVWGIC